MTKVECLKDIIWRDGGEFETLESLGEIVVYIWVSMACLARHLDTEIKKVEIKQGTSPLFTSFEKDL